MYEKYILYLLICLSFLLNSCGGGSSDVGITDYNVNGLVQKGPFIVGSSVIIQELDENLSPIGKSYNTVTTDDFGSFDLGSSINSRFVEIITTGFYFNEVKGNLSDSSITLRAVVDLSTGTNININILTTLESDRIRNLVRNENMSFHNASIKAEKEILNSFSISNSLDKKFSEMDITGSSDCDSVLLAISSIMLGDNSDAELSEFISKFINDMKTDGKIDNQTIISEIKENSAKINSKVIVNNINNRYKNLGLDKNISDFNCYLDSDGDGILNSEDYTISFSFEALLENYKNSNSNLFYNSNMLIAGGFGETAFDILDTNFNKIGTTSDFVSTYEKGNRQGQIRRVNNNIYIAKGELYIYNILDISNPEKLGELSFGESSITSNAYCTIDISKDEKYACLGTLSYSDKLRIVDISDKANPSLIQEITLDSIDRINDILFSEDGTYLYVSSEQGHFYIIQNNAGVFNVINRQKFNYSFSVSISEDGNTLYCFNGDFFCINVTDKNNISIFNNITLKSYASQYSAIIKNDAGTKLFACGNEYIYAFKIDDNVDCIGEYSNTSNSIRYPFYDISLDETNNKVYISSYKGLYVFNCILY